MCSIVTRHPSLCGARVGGWGRDYFWKSWQCFCHIHYVTVMWYVITMTKLICNDWGSCWHAWFVNSMQYVWENHQWVKECTFQSLRTALYIHVCFSNRFVQHTHVSVHVQCDYRDMMSIFNMCWWRIHYIRLTFGGSHYTMIHETLFWRDYPSYIKVSMKITEVAHTVCIYI